MKTNIDQLLTPKQKDFCDQYLHHRNATRAALEAGYSAATALSGYLMTLPKIKMYLEARMQQDAKKLDLDRDTILRELTKIALGNMANYFMPDGSMKPISQLTADELAAIQSVTTHADGTMKIKLYSKMQALEKLARYLNLYSTEEPQPEKVYVYIDKDQLNEDDLFEDGDDEDDDRNEEQENDYPKPEPSSRVRANSKTGPEPIQQLPHDDNYSYHATDGAGIPYKRNPDHYIDLNETPAQLIARINEIQRREQARPKAL